MSKITISIPVYNSEKYIGESIKSALDQTIKAKEIIIVDDASTDSTPEIVKSFPVRYVRNKYNMGIGYSRAKGIKLTKTKYISVFSADDYMLSDFNKVMLRFSKNYPNTFLYSDMYSCDRDLNIRSIFKSPRFNSYQDFVNGCLTWARRNNMFVVYNMFGPTKLWQEYNFDPNKRIGEDLEHLLRCVLIEKIKFKLVPVPLYKYRRHSSQMTIKKAHNIGANNRDTFNKINKLLGKKIL